GDASDHPGDAGRRAPGAGDGRRPLRRRRLRRRLLLPRRSQGPSAHPHADERGPHGGADRPRPRGLRHRGPRPEGHRLTGRGGARAMKALVKLKPEPGLWLRDDVPTPEIGPEDVLIRGSRSAICGTDLHIYNWDEWAQRTIPVPVTVGHEFVGSVAAVGHEVTGLKEGERVSGEGHITCGQCRNCRAGRRHLCRNTVGVGVNRPGSFAEYIAIPARNAYPIPAEIPDDIAAFLDPLGN